MRGSTAKQTKSLMNQAESQISLGICPVWSIFAMHFMDSLGPKLPSDWTGCFVGFVLFLLNMWEGKRF